MFDQTLDMLQLRMQCSAIGDIDLLAAAANREQRDAAFYCIAEKIKGGGIAQRVMRRNAVPFAASVSMRFDVGRTAGQHDTVQCVQQRLSIESLRQRWDHHRHCIGTAHNTVDIFLSNNVERMGIELPTTGRYTHQGSSFHRGQVLCRELLSDMSWFLLPSAAIYPIYPLEGSLQQKLSLPCWRK